MAHEVLVSPPEIFDEPIFSPSEPIRNNDSSSDYVVSVGGAGGGRGSVGPARLNPAVVSGDGLVPRRLSLQERRSRDGALTMSLDIQDVSTRQVSEANAVTGLVLSSSGLLPPPQTTTLRNSRLSLSLGIGDLGGTYEGAAAGGYQPGTNASSVGGGGVDDHNGFLGAAGSRVFRDWWTTPIGCIVNQALEDAGSMTPSARSGSGAGLSSRSSSTQARRRPANHAAARHPNAVVVTAYNILANKYISSEKYSHCPFSFLAEEVRLSAVVEEINYYDPDICIFAEVPASACAQARFGGALRDMGYVLRHQSITVRSGVPRPENEGVAIMFRADRFQEMEFLPIRFVNEAASSAPAGEREKLQSLTSHNVAVISTLKDFTTGDIYIVAGIHAYYDASKPDIQVWQMQVLLSKIEELKAINEDLLATTSVPPVTPYAGSHHSAAATSAPPAVRVVLMGDFNASLNTPSMRFVTLGSVPDDDREMLRFSGDATHGLTLKPAYEAYLRQYPESVTIAEPGYANCIDHIFFDPNAVQCLAVAHVAGAGDPSHPLPNEMCPSDHYPVSAVLLAL